jgi:preprotein translocase subunit SecB
MTPPDEVSTSGALRLGAIAQLQAIVLRQVDWKAYDVAVSAEESIDLEAEYNVVHGRSGSTARFQVRSRVTGKLATTEVFRAELVHEAFFEIPEDHGATDDELQAFGSVTVFFMVFPYIREFIHSLTGNAGLPALLLAPFRIPIDPAAGFLQLPAHQEETSTPELSSSG